MYNVCRVLKIVTVWIAGIDTYVNFIIVKVLQC